MPSNLQSSSSRHEVLALGPNINNLKDTKHSKIHKNRFSERTKYKKVIGVLQFNYQGSADFGEGHETSTSLFSTWGLGAQLHEFRGIQKCVWVETEIISKGIRDRDLEGDWGDRFRGGLGMYMLRGLGDRDFKGDWG